MGQKDIAEKILEAYNDVFSDIVNVLLFGGEEVLKAEELEEQAPRSAYKADDKYREIERDVAKRWKKKSIRVACIGLENQTKIDADMPLRIIGYDGAEYRTQLNHDDQQSRYPVVTMVLYFGHEKHWDKPLTLHGCLDIPEEFKPYVSDYRINLFEIAYLSREQVSLFKSDFKVVADYFVQKQETGDYVGSHETLKHVQETLSLMSVMTGDHRFEEVLSDKSGAEGAVIKTMCDVLDRIEEKGIEKGIEQGIERGIELGIEQGFMQGEMKKAREIALNLYAQGMEESVIAKTVGVAEAVIKQWISG